MPDSPSDTSIGSYDVFVSHRGIQMKLGFANRLYFALKDRGISSFLDIEELPQGRDVRPIMLEAVRRATIQVSIFTEDYGTSEWCLDELAEMMDCERSNQGKVIPVFYDVKPEHLRMEKGPFAEHLGRFLQNHNFGEERIKRWKDALRKASWMAGLWLETYGRREGALIEALVAKIQCEIFDILPVKVPTVVGLNSKIQDLEQRFRLHEETIVYVVLLWGMGGLGKTTLARAVYYHLRKHFEVASFVENCSLKEAIQIQDRLRTDLLRPNNTDTQGGDILKGRAYLEKALRWKKVLIVLDDMENDFNSVQKVLDPTSLHPGSRILVTSRNQRVFPHENDFSPVFGGDRYDLQEMNDFESSELFCLHAFKRPYADPEFQDLATKVVKACHGLPLALEVVGELLSTMKLKEQWEEVIVKLRSSKHKGISDSLKISYDALDDNEQQMFLDVACFLIEETMHRAKYFWAGSVAGYKTGLQKLRQLCLVKVNEEGCLTMHGLLRDLGREISRGSKTRMWDDEELQQLIRKKQDLDQIRGLVTSLPCLDASVLSRMRSLRLLSLNGTKLIGTCEGLNGLEITWLNWENCPQEAFPKQLSLEFLAVLRLRFKTDRLSEFPLNITKLRKLRELEICSQGPSQDSSFFSQLRRLWERCMSWCCRQQELGSLESLEVMRVSGLELITTLPSCVGQMKWLRRLEIRECNQITELPEDFGSLACLEVLLAHRLESITKLPSSFGQLKRLQELDISQCCGLEELPEDFGSLESLEVLKVWGLHLVTKFPSSFGQLKRLRTLDINFCDGLEELPEDFGSVECLEELSASELRLIKKLPSSFGQLKRLRSLDISKCNRLEELPEDFGSLECLEFLNVSGLELLNKLPHSFGQLRRLRYLRMKHCTRLEELPETFGSLECLEVLEAYGLSELTKLPSSFAQLKRLRELAIDFCYKLEELPEDFGSLECLEELEARELRSVTKLPSSFGQLKRLRHLDVNDCDRLEELPEDFGSLECLEMLFASGLRSVTNFPSSLRQLKRLLVWDNGDFKQVEGLPERFWLS